MCIYNYTMALAYKHVVSVDAWDGGDIHIYIYIRTYVYTYIHTYIHTYAYIHTYISEGICICS